MAYSTKLFIFFLLFVACLFGYNYFVKPFAEEVTVETAIQNTPNPTPLTQAAEDKIFDSLNTRQKVAQVLMTPVTISSLTAATQSAELAWVRENQPGFVIAFGSAVSTQSAEYLKTELDKAATQEPLDIILAVDHEGGTVQRLRGEGFTVVPSWEEVCAITDPNERKSLLKKSFNELQMYGVKVVLGPVFDTKVAGSPLRSRTCSTDQAIISERSKEYITLLQEARILPVLKHFPNIGLAKRDLHTNFDTISISTDDLLGFKNILSAFPTIGVMTTHVGVTNQNPDIPCSLSKDCVDELKTNYSSVLIFSDALEMQAAQGKISTSSAQKKSMSRLAQDALIAGNEVIILGESLDPTELTEVLDSLEKLYTANDAFKAHIDQSVKKIITYKFKLKNE